MRLIEYLFPTQCVICSKVGEVICQGCLKGMSHTLPLCWVCNKLSNGNLTHNKCSDLNVTYYTGWYLSAKVSHILEGKLLKGIWSTHLALLTSLITYLNIMGLIMECRVYPLPSKSLNTRKLNQYLCNNIKGRKKSNNILFVGERLGNINEVKEVIRGLSNSPLNIYILCLFVTN